MKKHHILSAAVLAASVSAACAQAPAGGSVFADFSLWSPQVQFAEPTDSVNALRIALYGENAGVTGLDVNVVGLAHGDFKGLMFGILYDQVDGDFYGAQAPWSAASYVKGDCYGVDSGVVNIVGGSLFGAQAGIWSSVGDEMTGLQLGFVNVAKSLNGLQVGLVNVATAGGYGLQIGVVNYLAGSEIFDVFPLVNFHF